MALQVAFCESVLVRYGMPTISRLVALALLLSACCNKLDDNLISPQVVALWTEYDNKSPRSDMKTKIKLIEVAKVCMLMADLPSKATKDSTLKYCANQTKRRFDGAGIQTTWGGALVPSDKAAECLTLGSTWSSDGAANTLFSILGITSIDCSGVPGAEKAAPQNNWKLKRLLPYRKIHFSIRLGF